MFGGGVDCVGVPYLVAVKMGLLDPKIMPINYARDPDGKELMNRLREAKELEQIRKNFLTGDMFVLRFARYPQHVAVYTGRNLIHAYSEAGKCVEHIYDDYWKKRFVAAFRFKEFA